MADRVDDTDETSSARRSVGFVDAPTLRADGQPPIPRRELLTLVAYLATGSHKDAAHRLGISPSTSRQRMSHLIRGVGACNAAQTVWLLRRQLEEEANAAAAPAPTRRATAGRIGHTR